MLRLHTMLLAALLMLIAAANGSAGTILTATLSHLNEPPGVMLTTITGDPRPIPHGFAVFDLDDTMTFMTMTATVFDIDFTGSQSPDTNDDLRAAHIHAGVTATPTWPVVWGFIGNPFNDTNPTDTVVTPFVTGAGATITSKWDIAEGNNTTLTAQIPNILAARAYVNFHTNQNPGGEIRGTLQVVPEPSTVLMFSAGVLGFVALRRRRGVRRG